MHKGLPQILREGKGIKAHLALINRFLVLVIIALQITIVNDKCIVLN